MDPLWLSSEFPRQGRQISQREDQGVLPWPLGLGSPVLVMDPLCLSSEFPRQAGNSKKSWGVSSWRMPPRFPGRGCRPSSCPCQKGTLWWIQVANFELIAAHKVNAIRYPRTPQFRGDLLFHTGCPKIYRLSWQHQCHVQKGDEKNDYDYRDYCE